ncbi:MAG TPA: LysR family transcriptional regulator [Solirubrobacteraceae bacterium]|nr:LysR family transcriptional regulator [Solirubrobacteraceae bacterium]
MNLQQLEYFLASAERGSFSAAAEALHLAQPSVSEQVRRLEAELGVALFARVGRGLALTEAGRTLRPHAEAVLDEVREARESVVAVREVRGGTVSFGTFSTARDYLGSDLVTEFRRRHPNVRVRILGLNSAEAAQDVRDGRLEAAIVALPVDDDGLDVRPVADDELYFASIHASHLRRPMTIERLSELPVVMGDASYRLQDPTRRHVAELAQRAGVTLEPVVDVETVATVLDLVAAGVGDTILERGLLVARGGGMSKRIGWVPFADPIMITLAFVTRRDAPLSPAARVMVELVEERLRLTAAELAKAPRKRLPS